MRARKTMFGYIVVGAVLAVVAVAVWMRVAPLNADQWHDITLPVGQAGEVQNAQSFTVVRQTPYATRTLIAMDEIILNTPRTQRIAGGVEDHKITYVTRSLIFGFPDYTTIAAGPPDATRGAVMANFTIFGRARFGKADLGVNHARITDWLAQLDALNIDEVSQ